MGELGEVAVPFRWDLVSPDQLGLLLAGAGEPDLWFLDSLVACAGKVVARGSDGDLFFVGPPPGRGQTCGRSRAARVRACSPGLQRAGEAGQRTDLPVTHGIEVAGEDHSCVSRSRMAGD